MSVDAVLKQAEALPVVEQLELISRLWDRLPDDALPELSPDESAELERRADEADANPHEGATIEEVIARITDTR